MTKHVILYHGRGKVHLQARWIKDAVAECDPHSERVFLITPLPVSCRKCLKIQEWRDSYAND